MSWSRCRAARPTSWQWPMREKYLPGEEEKMVQYTSLFSFTVSCYLAFDCILSAKLLPHLWFLLQVASGWALKTHTTLHSKCFYLWNLKLTGSYAELTAPLLSAASTAFWHVEAIGNYSAFEPKPLVSVSPANNHEKNIFTEEMWQLSHSNYAFWDGYYLLFAFVVCLASEAAFFERDKH